MDTVFILSRECNEYEQILGVYHTRDKANNALKNFLEYNNPHWRKCTVEKYLNKPNGEICDGYYIEEYPVN